MEDGKQVIFMNTCITAEIKNNLTIDNINNIALKGLQVGDNVFYSCTDGVLRQKTTQNDKQARETSE